MELWRTAANPWGQEVLIGISWSLMWAAVFAGVAFTVAHAVWAKWLAPAESTDTDGAASAEGLPAQILRHAFSERVFHWVMSAAMLVLLVTAFLPIMGIQFAWVTIHWIAGLVLTATILYHIIHATFWQDFWAMWVNGADIKAGIAELGHMTGGKGDVPKAAKYPIDHKMFHHGAAVSGLTAIVTGILMMLRIDTWFGAANPYLLDITDSSWGVVYVVHGVSGVALFGLIITHIYFAIRPDKWWITKSMIYGFISRDEYAKNFDPQRWPIDGAAAPEELVPAGVGASESGSDAPAFGSDAPDLGGDDAPSGGGDAPSSGGDASSGGGDAPSSGGDASSGGGDASIGGGDASAGDSSSGGGGEPSASSDQKASEVGGTD